jgi:hypothetical protein
MDNNNDNSKMEDSATGKRVSLSPGCTRNPSKEQCTKADGSASVLFMGNNENVPNQKAGSDMGKHQENLAKTKTPVKILHDANVANVVVAYEAKAAAAKEAAVEEKDAALETHQPSAMNSLMAMEEKEDENSKKPAAKNGVSMPPTKQDTMRLMAAAPQKSAMKKQATMATTMGGGAAVNTSAMDMDAATTPDASLMDEDPPEDLAMALVGNQREMVKYVKVMFPVTNAAKGGDVIKALHGSFLTMLKALNVVNFWVMIMKFNPGKTVATTKGAIPMDRVEKDLPEGLAQLNLFTSGLRAQTNAMYTCFTMIKLGLQGCFLDFLTAASMNLAEIGGKIYEAPLQFADMVFDGYLAGAHTYINLKWLLEILTFQGG